MPLIEANSCPRPSLLARSDSSNLDSSSTSKQPKESIAAFPSSLQIRTLLKGLEFSLKTSDHSDELHQFWLGSCGVKSGKAISAAGTSRFAGIADRIWRGFANNKASNQEDPLILIEKRRAFQLDLNFKSLQADCVINDEPVTNRSKVLDAKDLSLSCRSIWTPFGLYSSLKSAGEVGARKYFESDPNEHAIVGEASLGEVSGDINLEHVASLLTFSALAKAEFEATRQKKQKTQGYQQSKSFSDSSPPFDKSKQKEREVTGIPRLAISMEVKNIHYEVTSRRRDKPANPAAPSQSTLIISLPRIGAVLHVNYQ